MLTVLFFIIESILAIMVFFAKTTALKKRPTKFAVFCISLLFSMICAIRNSTIKDTDVYVDAFTIGDDRMEFGFMFLVSLIKKLSSTPAFIFASIGFLSVGIKLLFFRSYSCFFLTTLLVYISGAFISGDFVAIRAGLVSSFVFWAVKFAIDKKALLFILTILLASTFHITAVVCLMIWPLVNLNISLKVFLWFIPISYLIYFTGHSFGFLASYINIPYVQSLYALYTGELGDEIDVVNVFSNSQVIRASFCMFVIWKTIQNNMLNKMDSSFIKVYCFGICIFVLMTDVPAFSSRISALFIIGGVYVIGNLFNYIPSLKETQIKWIIVSLAYINLVSEYLNVLR